MFSFECNIFCDGNDCEEIVSGEPGDVEGAIESTIAEAKDLGWHFELRDNGKLKALCPDCQPATPIELPNAT